MDTEQKKKDIIIMVGGGGMTGVFSSGVLSALESGEIYKRVYAIYGSSVGACTAARYVVKESQLGGETFYTRFNTSAFIKGGFVRYFLRTLLGKEGRVLDFSYFKKIILESSDRIDMTKLLTADMSFFVKVFNQARHKTEYISVENPHAYEKIMASASLAPLTTEKIILDSTEFFDGDSISSDIDESIVRAHPDKTIIRIRNRKDSLIGSLWTVPIVYMLFARLYGFKTANIYLRSYFKKYVWEKKIAAYSNVITVTSDIQASLFSKDEGVLRSLFEEGKEKGRATLNVL